MAKRPTPKRVRLLQRDDGWQVVDAESGVPLHQGDVADAGLDSFLATRGMVVVTTKPKEQADG